MFTIPIFWWPRELLLARRYALLVTLGPAFGLFSEVAFFRDAVPIGTSVAGW